MTELDIAVYFGLFSAALVAATLLPAQSELLLAGLLTAGGQPVWALILVAWIGNTFGSIVNWILGSFFYHLRDRKWFPIKQNALEKAQQWYCKYGRWALMFSWAPFIGDPITLASGILREPLWSFVVIVALAKLARYLVVAAVALRWFC